MKNGEPQRIGDTKWLWMLLCLISQTTSSLPFLLPFILILVCVCVRARVCACVHIRVYTGALMSMNVLVEARGGTWGPYFTILFCLEMGSLTEARARLMITKS